MSKWLAHVPGPSGTVLVCFPFAGGSASAFAAWRRALAPDLTVCAVQLPGREGRAAEPRLRNYAMLREALTWTLLPVLAGRTVVFYGHSLGAWLAWDMARMLASAGTRPLGLVVGAQRAPSCPYPFRAEATLGDEELIRGLGDADALCERVINDSFLRQWMLPLMRDDLSLCETYPATEAAACFPIHALAGGRDALVHEDEVRAWERHTTRGFHYSALDGGHFFLRSHRDMVLDLLRQSVREWTTHAHTE